MVENKSLGIFLYAIVIFLTVVFAVLLNVEGKAPFQIIGALLTALMSMILITASEIGLSKNKFRRITTSTICLVAGAIGFGGWFGSWDIAILAGVVCGIVGYFFRESFEGTFFLWALFQ